MNQMAPASSDQKLGTSLIVRENSTDRRFALHWILILAALTTLFALGLHLSSVQYRGSEELGEFRKGLKSTGGSDAVESEKGVVAADDGYCSEIGASVLRKGGHAVDAVVATAICEGVRHPMSSGIGGGAFMVVRSAKDGKALAFDARETAPLAASKDMYQNNPLAKSLGPLSMGIPGEIAGLHAAWLLYGKLPWKSLFEPSITLLKNGVKIEPYLALSINDNKDKIMSDPGLAEVFAPNGKLLQLNDTFYNFKLADSLEAIAEEGPQAFYNGSIGQKFIQDIRNLGGIVTMNDMRKYTVEITEPLYSDVLGYTLVGMPLPSSGTLGVSMVLNILGSYETLNAMKGFHGLHRLIEAVKHTLAIRMNLGDSKFVNCTKYVDDMLSPTYAEQVKERIFDNTTFDPSYYLNRWSQIRDHGTSHMSIVDSERNAVAFTSTVNMYFGGGVMSPSTGIVANNEMDDFSIPTDATEDGLPPAPSNFIEPNKRPLSSMSPLIILKDNQLAGVLGASGGMNIIPAVSQVFINHFVLGVDPLKAVQHPRFYHTLIPNLVQYENWTALDGELFEFSEAAKEFLAKRNHQLQMKSGAGAVCQFVVQNLTSSNSNKETDGIIRGMLTAVSDPRKDGSPACV
uniref:Glutathione hydrolase n=1 Tax=Allium sativum TaxID=4682 RepID=A0A0B6VSN3_ALLSA|nr:gamma-glutamyl transpeptidase [Allium sativum]